MPRDERGPGVFRDHPTAGAELLEGGRGPVLRLAAEIAGSHHEHWDGSGHPEGLAGEEIPLAARIVAVADYFDHLQYDAPDQRDASEALAKVEQEAGVRFDPGVVEALVGLHAVQHA